MRIPGIRHLIDHFEINLSTRQSTPRSEQPRKGFQVSNRSRYGKYETIRQFAKREDVLIIRKKDIKASERKGTLPEQGYVWL